MTNGNRVDLYDFPDLILDECDPKEANSPTPVSVWKLMEDHLRLKPVIIDGYLRLGEILNLIAGTKAKKTWQAYSMAFGVATGTRWLGQSCSKGRVLIVDNELHPETISSRLRAVAEAMDIEPREVEIDVLSLRGEKYDIGSLAALLERIGGYSLIVLDALYRFLPAGTSENDNGQMMVIYNTLDAIAKQQDAAIVIVHHTSKGDQSGKTLTDVGSGAGAISRAADAHLSIRPHEEPGYFVLDAVTRSFENPEAKSIYFDFPLWKESALEAKVRTNQKANGQDKRDSETVDKVLEALNKHKKKRMTEYQIRTETGFGLQRVQRGLNLLESEGKVTRVRVKSKKTGKPTNAARLV